jgi:putative peptidoglycan lipid II flippase
LRTLFSRGLRDTIVVVVPAALAYIVLATPVVRLLLQHGHADAKDAELIAQTLRAFSVGLPFFSAFQLLTRTFYAMQDTRTPALVNMSAAVVNIAVDLLFVFGFRWGVSGLALGHAASYLFATAVCLYLLRRRLGSIDGRRVLGTAIRVIPASLVAVAAAFLAYEGIRRAVPDPNGLFALLLEVGVAIVAGLLVFVVSALIFGIQEADEVKDAVLRRFRG